MMTKAEREQALREYHLRIGDTISEATHADMHSAFILLHSVPTEGTEEEQNLLHDLQHVSSAQTRSEFISRGETIRKKWDIVIAMCDYVPEWNNAYAEFIRCLEREQRTHAEYLKYASPKTERLNRTNKYSLQVGDVLRFVSGQQYIITNIITGSDRFGNPSSVSVTIQDMKTKQTIYAYPSSQLYGAEILKNI